MFNLTDTVANTQRFAVDNSQNTELGSATPSGELSVNGKSILSGAVLNQGVAAPVAMPRLLGSVNLAVGQTATVSIPATTSALSSVDGPGAVVAYSSDKTQMTIACFSGSGSNLNYGSF